MPDSLATAKSLVPSTARPPPFQCSWTGNDDAVAWVHVAGALGLGEIASLQRALGEGGLRARLVVLDLRQLASIDGAGVRAIVEAGKRARRAGRRLILLRGPAVVDRMFAGARTADEVETFDLDLGCPPVMVLLEI